MIDEILPKIASLSILGIPAGIHAVFAEAGVVSPDWMGSITQISAFGLVAWIVFHLFSSALPKMQQEHAAQMEAQRLSHAASTKMIADAHALAVSKMSDAFQVSLTQQRADLLALRSVCRWPAAAADPKQSLITPP